MADQPTPENTSVETATVQIRTLNVGAKQLTQGIFRQLVEQPVVNVAGRIDGAPWGIVNYHPDRCDEASQHLHVVWQLGNQLRRAYVAGPEHALLRHPLVSEYLMARIFEGARQDFTHSSPGDLQVLRTPSGRQITASVYVRGVKFFGSVLPAFRDVWVDSYSYPEEIDRLPAEFERSYNSKLRSAAEVAELLPAEAYKAAWRELSALPQLFIGR